MQEKTFVDLFIRQLAIC